LDATSHIVVGSGLGECGGPVQNALNAGGYANVSFAAGADAMITLCTHMRVDLLLLALGRSPADGLAVLNCLSGRIDTGDLQVIVVTADGDESLLTAALALGARDFVREPVDPAEVTLRVRNGLAASALHGELRARNRELQQTIVARSHELSAARREVLGHLSTATEFRDDETGEHTERVGRTVAAIAAGFGLDVELVRMVRVAAPLHDVGKIGLPDRILLKPGPLTETERAVMRTHTQIGAAILSNSDVPELQLAEEIALGHHERWDGGGYPYGLTGVSIPIAARIVAIADVFDALVHARPYKEAWPLPRALAEITDQRGRHFDAALVEVFMDLDHAHLMSPITLGHGAFDRAPIHGAIEELHAGHDDGPPESDRPAGAAMAALARS
jgi:putative two-component system response regulator